MGFNFEKYVKRSAKDAFSRISDDISNKLEDAATNAISGALGKGLKAIGLSNKIVNNITSKFADSVKADLGAQFYGKVEPVTERIAGEGIRANRAPNFTGVANVKTNFERKIASGSNWSSLSVDGDGKKDPNFLAHPANPGIYYMALEFREYQRPAPLMQASGKLTKTIFLPIPRNLVEQHKMTYDAQAQGAAGGIMDDILSGKSVGSSLDVAVGGQVAKIVSNALNGVIDDAGDATLNALQQSYGFAINPHLSVMFKGGNLRNHEFTWMFAPESVQESLEILNIIQVLRQSSLPQFFSNATALFDYPQMCKVKFYPWARNKGESGRLERDLYVIKQCVISDIDINYAPNGVPSFFAGTSLPTFIQLRLGLQEIEYHTQYDYGKERTRDQKEFGIVTKAQQALQEKFGAKEGEEE